MFLVPVLLAIGAVASPQLVRESLTGIHYRSIQNGEEVHVTVRPDGSREETRARIAGVRREITTRGLLRTLREIDPVTGRLLREVPLYYNAKPARVFDPNPVTLLNDPSLEDRSDSPSAVPDHAYRIVDLQDLAEGVPLRGPHIQIEDFQAPFVPPVSSSQSLLFDRSDSGFEDVNAYFHIDRSQRYLQSLGYDGPRSIARYPISVDTHALSGEDNSFFIASTSSEGTGSLVFGEGGTDDAEDSDLIVHEYAHAIHEWIAPGTFLGARSSQARAISEGFGDYWALSSTYEAAIRSGRDPFCFADWDARCGNDPADQRCAYPPGADCLRRMDSGKTIRDFLTGDVAGIEHRNGEIWTSALREIFVALTARYGVAEGRRLSDLIVIESLFGTPPHPSFEGMARRMVVADQYLNGGNHREVICAAMSARGILMDCAVAPRGELHFFQSPARGAAIPDNDLGGVILPLEVTDSRLIERLLVNVHIVHPQRGELRLALIAPDGTEVRLQNSSADLTADIWTTFGRDTLSAQSLDVFRGRPARGEWRLRVADAATGMVGTVVSWNLLIQFAGEEPASVRPSGTGLRQTIPIVGHAPGANGTFFMSDIRLLNPGARDADVLLVFTPSAADGRDQFSAVRLTARAGELIAFDDVVRSVFSSGGTGQLEITGDVVVSSRTYTRSSHGEFGFSAAPQAESVAAGEEPLIIHQLESAGGTRSNIGWAETAGQPGRLRLELFDARSGVVARIAEYTLLPFTQMQVPVEPEGTFVARISVIEGGARVVAYGAVVDNRSGDPILVAGQRADQSRTLVAPAISGPGVASTYWLTDVTVTPLGRVVGSINIGFLNAETLEPVSRTFATGPPFTSIDLVDAVRVHFQQNAAGGARGTLASAGSPHRIIGSVIRTETGAGSFGMYVPFAAPSRQAVQHLLHVENSSEFRTNIGAVTADDGAELLITVFDAAGRSIESSRHFVPPFQLIQFPVRQPVRQGWARVELLSGSAYAYASVVSNRSGDPIFVPAQ